MFTSILVAVSAVVTVGATIYGIYKGSKEKKGNEKLNYILQNTDKTVKEAEEAYTAVKAAKDAFKAGKK